MNETLKAYVAEQALTAVGARRLLRLAKFLHTMPLVKFNFSVIIDESGKSPLEALKAGEQKCGTVGCAIGWMPAVFPRDLQWTDFLGKSDGAALEVRLRDSTINDFYAAAEYFGLSQSEAEYLFSPDGSMYTEKGRYLRHNVGSQATSKDVARHIRKFVRANYVGKAKLDFA